MKSLLCLLAFSTLSTIYGQMMNARSSDTVTGQYWCVVFTPALPVSFANYYYRGHKWVGVEGVLGGVAAQIVLGRGNGTPEGEIKGNTIVSGGLGVFQGQRSTVVAGNLGLGMLQGMVGYDFSGSCAVVGFGINVTMTQFSSMGSILLWKRLIR